MTPNQVACMDAVDFLNSFEDKALDVIITDPPFGIGIHKMNYTRSTKGGVAKRTDYSTHKNDWDANAPTKEIIDLILSKSKNTVIFGANNFSHLLPHLGVGLYGTSVLPINTIMTSQTVN